MLVGNWTPIWLVLSFYLFPGWSICELLWSQITVRLTGNLPIINSILTEEGSGACGVDTVAIKSYIR